MRFFLSTNNQSFTLTSGKLGINHVNQKNHIKISGSDNWQKKQGCPAQDLGFGICDLVFIIVGAYPKSHKSKEKCLN